MLETIFAGLKALTGFSDAITNITKSIADAKIAAIRAATEEERIHANERASALEKRRDVLIAEAAVSKANIIMRCGFGIPVMFVLWKLFIWDKALGQWTGGSTDALSHELWGVVNMVLGFYFLYEGAVSITRLLRR